MKILTTVRSYILAVLYLFTVSFGDRCVYNFNSKDNTTGIFKSPNYPNNYPKKSACVYHFQGSKDERIRINFTAFDLDTGTVAGCLFDYIDVYSIDATNMKYLIERLCGSKIPNPIASVHSRIEIKFKSDYIDGHRGFLGKYEFIDETWQPFPSDPSCGSSFVTGVGGQLVSPGFPSPYPNDVECSWMIKVDESQKILLNFVELDLGQSINCKDSSATTVMIYNGFASERATPTETLCGQLSFYTRQKGITVKEFKSEANRVHIRFKSSTNNEYRSKGFKMAWTAVWIPQYGTLCPGFHCRGGEMCIDTKGLLCNPLPRYCIDKSLVCNDLPNCGAYDTSDEDGCLRDILIIALSVGGALISIIAVVVGVYFCRKRRHYNRSPSQEQALTSMTLQKLDRSPSAVKKHQNDSSLKYPVTDKLLEEKDFEDL